jgi:hypothetical protein
LRRRFPLNKKFAAVFLALALANACFAQQPAQIDFTRSGRVSSVRLEAHATASAKVTFRNTETDYGTYDRDFQRNKSVATSTVNTGRVPASVRITIYWFAQNLADKKTVLFAFDENVSEIKPMTTFKANFDMPTLESSVLNLQALGEKWVSGAKFAGWLVVATEPNTPGVVLSHYASTPAIEALARKELAEMVAKKAAQAAQ